MDTMLMIDVDHFYKVLGFNMRYFFAVHLSVCDLHNQLKFNK